MHGFPDGCATDASTGTTTTKPLVGGGDVATAHVRKTTEDDVRAGAWWGLRGAVPQPGRARRVGGRRRASRSGSRAAGFILKADGVSGRTLTDSSWTGGVDADYSEQEAQLLKQRQLLKPRFSLASIAMMLACVRRLRAASRPAARIVLVKADAAGSRSEQPIQDSLSLLRPVLHAVRTT